MAFKVFIMLYLVSPFEQVLQRGGIELFKLTTTKCLPSYGSHLFCMAAPAWHHSREGEMEGKEATAVACSEERNGPSLQTLTVTRAQP